jgi:hypothetical protein
MKKFLVLAVALALTAASSRAQNGQLVITELNESIVATFNGSPISPTLSGPVDGWTIQLPTGFSLANIMGNLYNLGEPESATTRNDVAVTQPTFLTWNSDLTGPPLGSPTSLTVPNAGTFQGPTGGSVPIDLTISDQQSRTVPDTGSTALLLGIPAVALFLMTVRRKSTI